MAEPAPEAAPPGIDTSRPHSARMYDYFIGGKNHFAADRETAEKMLLAAPGARTGARENRAFLARAVRHLTREAGISQFLDIGTGLPATGSVHEVAQAINPSARVVYADNDPLVLTHARALLRSAPEGRTAYIQADLRAPESILGDPATRETLDFTRPIGLMLVAVLHFILDADDPARTVKTLLDALPAGSYLVASHSTAEHAPAEAMGAGVSAYRGGGVTLRLRDSDEFAALAFNGLSLVDPGVVLVSEWRPTDPPPRPSAAEVGTYGGVGRKI
ncbi:MAG: SAM-dependent methyltransferase [Streptosporangiales bacterium]|nr:SAM-dependent methyltransferase [Streptosporangiales bacterium]